MQRHLPSVALASKDPFWLGEVRALLARIGAPVVGAVDGAKSWLPAGLCLVDNRLDAYPPSPYLKIGVDPDKEYDLPWPMSEEALIGALTAIAANLQQRGLLREDVAFAAFSRLIELTTESIEVVDERVRLLYVNPAFEAITGYTLPEVLGRTTGELFRAGTHDPSFYAEIMQTLRTGEPWRGQLVARRADGALSYQETVLAPFAGADGTRLGFVALKRDLARDALVARAMDRLDDQRAALLQQVADAFLLHNEAGEVLDRNDQAVTMFRLDQYGSVMVGMNPDDAKQLAAEWLTMAAGEPLAMDVSLLDGRSVSFRSVRVRVAGETMVLSLVRDITERVHLERRLARRSQELAETVATLESTSAALIEREKQAALGGLVAGVAHELNTPLGIAVTATSLAAEAAEELASLAKSASLTRRDLLQNAERSSEALTLAAQQLQRASRLVQDFKRLSIQETASAPATIDVMAYLQRVLAGLHVLLQEHQVSVRVEGAFVQLLTDGSAFAQVITQVFSNCAHHAPGRPVRVQVSRERAWVQVDVIDGGPGLELGTESRIFEPFFTTARGKGHVGLGLHVCHGLVHHRLRGSISVTSGEHGGTHVRVMMVDQGWVDDPMIREDAADSSIRTV